MSVNLNVEQFISETLQENWYVLLEKPDGTFESKQSGAGGIVTFELETTGIYKVYSYGDLDPGTVTESPTNIPMPTGTNIPSTQRMFKFNIKTLKEDAPPIDLEFRYDRYVSNQSITGTQPLEKLDPCSSYLANDHQIFSKHLYLKGFDLLADPPEQFPLPGLPVNYALSLALSFAYDGSKRYFISTLSAYTNRGKLSYFGKSNNVGVILRPLIFQDAAAADDEIGEFGDPFLPPNTVEGVAYDPSGIAYLEGRDGNVLAINTRDFTSVDWLQFVDKNENIIYDYLDLPNIFFGDYLNNTGLAYWGGYIYSIYSSERVDDIQVTEVIRFDPNNWTSIRFTIETPIATPFGGAIGGGNTSKPHPAVAVVDGYLYMSFYYSSFDRIVTRTALGDGFEDGEVYNSEYYSRPSDEEFAAIKWAGCTSGITKTVDKSVASPGEEVTFTLRIINGSDLPYKNISFADTLPAELTFVAGSVFLNGVNLPNVDISADVVDGSEQLDPGESDTLTFKAVIDPTLEIPYTIINEGIVKYIDENEIEQEENPKATILLPDSPNFYNGGFLKSVDKAHAKIGDEITYTFEVENKGNITAENVKISDPLSSKVEYVSGSLTGATGSPNTSITIGSIGALGKSIVTFKVKVIEGVDGSTIENYGILSYDYTSPRIGENSEILESNTVITTIGDPIISGADLEGAKKSIDKTEVNVGDIVTFTFVIPNGGNETAENVVFKDVLPAELELVPDTFNIDGVLTSGVDIVAGVSLPDILPGEAVLVTFQAKAITEVATPIENVGTIDYFDLATGDKSTNTTIVTIPSIGPALTGANFGTSIKTSNVANATIGDIITYTLEIENSGQLDATDVVLTDPIVSELKFIEGTLKINGVDNTTSNPSTGIVLGTVFAGETVTVEFNVEVLEVPATNPYVNKGNIIYNDSTGDGQVAETTGASVNISEKPVPSLGESTKVVDKSQAKVNDILTYTFTLNNTGNGDAINVLITEVLPEGLSFVTGSVIGGTGDPEGGIIVGTIAAGENKVISYQVLIDTLPNPPVIINYADVSYENSDGVTATDNIGPATTIVEEIDGADLSTNTKVADKTTANVGDVINYTIEIPNTSSVDATNVRIIDPISNELSLVDGSVLVTGNTGTLSGNPTVNPGLNIGTIPAGNTAIVLFSIKINALPNPAIINNEALIKYDDITGTDKTITTPLATTEVSSVDTPDFGTTTKTVNNVSPSVGDEIIYTITIPNTGAVDATGVTVYDALTSGLTLISATLTGVVGPATGELNVAPGLNIGTIAAGSTAILTVTVRVDSLPSTNPFANKVTINSNETTEVIITGQEINVLPAGGPNFGTTTKLVDNASPNVGDEVTYTVSIPNTGDTDATDVTVYDALTTGIVLVGTPTVSGNTGTVTGDLTTFPGLNIGTVSAGATATVSFKVRIDSIPVPNPFVNEVIIDSANTTPVTITGGELNVNGTGPNFGSSAKVVDNANPSVGDEVNYTVTIPNTGDVDATNVKVYDNLPSGLSVESIALSGVVGPLTGTLNVAPGVNIGTIKPGETATLTFKIKINSLPTPNPFENKVEIISDQTQTPTITTGGGIDVGINPGGGANFGNTSKFVNNGTPSIGDIVSYTIEIPNDGPEDAFNVTLLDLLASGLSVVGTPTVTGNVGTVSGLLNVTPGLNIGTIPANSTATVKFNVKVDSLPTPNPYSNKVTINYTDSKGDNSFVSEGGQLNVGGSNGGDLGGTIKKVDNTNPQVGDKVVYTIEVPNTGLSVVENVTLFDALPSEFILVGEPTVSGATGTVTGTINVAPGLNIGSILAGGKAIVQFTLSIEAIPSINPFENKVIISFDDVNGSHVTTVTGGGVSVTPSTGSNLTSAIKDVDKTLAAIGETLTYTVKVPNTGVKNALNVTVFDDLADGLVVVGTPTVTGNVGTATGTINVAPGLNVGTVLAGATAIVTFQIRIDSIPESGLLENKVTITYTDEDGKPGVTVTPTTGTTITGGPDFGGNNFKKTADKVFADIDEVITYTFEIKNDSIIDATNVIVKDELSSALEFVSNSVKVDGISVSGDITSGINIGTIKGGETVLVLFEAKALETGLISNKGNISYEFSGGEGSSESEENKIQINTGKLTPEDVTKSAGNDITQIGDIVTYTITIKNSGNVKIYDILVKDPLSESLLFKENSIKVNGSAVAGNITEGISIPDILPGEITLITFEAEIVEEGKINNTAEVDYSYKVDPDSEGVNENINITSPEIDSINVKDGVKVSKSTNKNAAIVGDVVRYTIKVDNTNPISIEDIIVKDDLPFGLEYIGNLTINGAASSQDIATGVNVGTLEPGESVEVEFDVKLVSVPESGNISNVSNTEFNYTLGGNNFEENKSSEGSNLEVLDASIKTEKRTDVSFVRIGDEFNYTITMTNEGNIESTNILFKDELPSQLEVVEIKVDGEIISGDLEKGINVGSLAISETKTIVLRVRVNSFIEGFTNIAEVEASFKPDPNAPESEVDILIEETDEDGNMSELIIINPNLELVKTSKQLAIAVGEVLDYEIVVNNTGNVDALNVVVSDLLSENLEFVLNSVMINEKSVLDANINAGVVIEKIAIGESVKVKFKAKVLSKLDSEISNQAMANYEFVVNDEKQFATNLSNIHSLPVRKVMLDIKKSSNVEFASLEDVIEYTIRIENTGEIDATNVRVYDYLSKYAHLVEGSVKINGVTVHSVDWDKGLVVGTVKVEEVMIITYLVKITGTSCNKTLVNKVGAKFIYNINNLALGEMEVTGEEMTNSIDLCISAFKQLSVEKELLIPEVKPDIETLNEMTGEIIVSNCHLIETHSLVSQEGQKLTNYKLVISGNLKVVVKYTALDLEQSVHSACYNIPFSTFIVMPPDYVAGSKIDLDGVVEDIYFKALSERRFFINATVLMNAKIINC